MSFNFPDAPSVGDVFPPYEWDGEKWFLQKKPGTGNAIVTVSDTPPLAPLDSQFWWCSLTGVLYFRFNDGSSSQWVVAAPGEKGDKGNQGIQGIQGIQGPIGPPMTVYISDTPPASPLDNTLWYESDSGLLSLRYRDDDSSQWISLFGGYADSVRYGVTQALSTPQQAQARTNIGAPPNTVVRYDVAQTLATPEQAQARTNIGAAQATAFDTGWTPFPYVNGWVDYAAPYGPCGFRKNPNGVVFLKGLVQNGTATTICTLPAGYRPGVTLLLNVQTSPNAACRLDISAGGVITHTGGNNGWISLGGITFLAEN